MQLWFLRQTSGYIRLKMAFYTTFQLPRPLLQEHWQQGPDPRRGAHREGLRGRLRPHPPGSEAHRLSQNAGEKHLLRGPRALRVTLCPVRLGRRERHEEHPQEGKLQGDYDGILWQRFFNNGLSVANRVED